MISVKGPVIMPSTQWESCWSFLIYSKQRGFSLKQQALSSMLALPCISFATLDNLLEPSEVHHSENENTMVVLQGESLKLSVV